MAVRICDDEKPYVEWIDGQSFPKVSLQRKHGKLEWRFGALLDALGGTQGEVAAEWRCYLPDGPHGPSTLVPDVAFISFERLRSLSDQEVEQPPFAPDVVVEIRSPSYRERLAAEKIALYLRYGTRVVLDVDPERRCITAHAPEGVAAFDQSATFEHAAVPWLRFEIAPLFANLEFRRG